MRKALQLRLASPLERGLLAAVYLAILILLAACQPAVLRPPRLENANSSLPLFATAEPIFLPAPTITPAAESTMEPAVNFGSNPSLKIWINETSGAHEQAVAQMMAAFEEKYQINAEWRLVAPTLLPHLMETAVISGTLPDIVLHPVSYSVGWAERNILDAAVTQEIVDQIGPDTFDPEALAAVTINGLYAAIPSDGYQQLLIYREDWADEKVLATPDDYDSMIAMAAASFDPANVISGIIIPTESDLITTQQSFEQIATANGCQLVDEKGEILIREPACEQALDFYFSIVNQFSPVGVQTDTSARNAYLAGHTAMIITSPDILPQLAGLDDNVVPTCPECAGQSDYLAKNSGILTSLTGAGPAAIQANFGTITSFGVTRQADKQTATAFASYWFNEGYETWLAVESERKVPMRWGTASQPRLFIDNWGTQPLLGSNISLVDVYGETVIGQLRDRIADSSRWGFRQGQASLITTLHEAFILPVVLQEMLSGYFDSDQTILEMYARITDLIPNYRYDTDTGLDVGSGT